MKHDELRKAVSLLNAAILSDVFQLYINAMKVKEAVANYQHDTIILQLNDGECIVYEPLEDSLNLVLRKEILNEK